MKSLSGMLGGGVVVTVWKMTPGFIKYPFVLGVTMMAGAELSITINHALQAANIFSGQGAQGEAQTADPTVTLRKLHAGLPVTSAAATVATTVDKTDEEARKLNIENNANGRSIDEIRAAKRAGQHVSAAEDLMLVNYETKDAERTKAVASAQIEVANSTAAQAQADAHKAAAKYTEQMIHCFGNGPMSAADIVNLSQNNCGK